MMSSKSFSDSELPDSGTTATRSRTRRPRLARRPILSGAALAVCLGSAFLAARQEGRPNPYRAASLGSVDWWLHPVERNAFRQVTAISSNLNTVFALPDGQHLWAAGEGGLVIWSVNGGRSWGKGIIVGPSSRPVGAPPGRADTAAPGVRTPSIDSAGPPMSSAASLGMDRASVFSGLGVLLRRVGAAQVQGATQGAQEPEPAARAAAPARDSTASSSPPAAAATPRPPPPAVDTAAAGWTGNLRDIFFLDESLGWAVAEDGTILRTQDGGRRWSATPAGRWGSLNAIHFENPQEGRAVGEEFILRTTSGGDSWEVESSTLTGFLADLGFAGAMLWAVSSDGILLQKPAGGAWRHRDSPGLDVLNRISFLDPRTGWVLGIDNGPDSRASDHVILQTRDGGATWSAEQLRTASPIHDLHFANRQIGVAVGAAGTIHATRDGGTRWTEGVAAAGTRATLKAVHMANNQQGWAVGDRGTVLATGNGGRSWRILAGGGGDMAGVDFVTAEKGWAVGTDGTILHTRDGGRVWSPQRSGTVDSLRGVSFVDERRGWAVGANGAVLRTRDGGSSWISLEMPDSGGSRPNLTAVHFLSTTSGWAVSEQGGIHQTLDGGLNWRSRGGSPGALRDVFFWDALRGWAVGLNGQVLRTVDGGANWLPATPATTADLNAVWFLDELVGWVVGSNGTVLTTRNGGRDWVQQSTPVRKALLDVRFVDSSRGWAAGWDGVLLATTDGGKEWRVVVPQDRRAAMDLTSLDGLGGSVWVVGAGGAVLHTSDGGSWADPVSRSMRFPAPWYFLSWAVVLGLLFAIPDRRPPTAENSVADLLISDRPLARGDPDPVDLNGVALGLSRFLRNEKTDPPLTIAVTGAWGTGKTSLMNLVLENLRYHGFRPVWFNAWHHQTEEHLLASLLETVRRQALPSWLTPEGLVFRANLLRVRARRHTTALLVLGVLAVTYAGYLAGDPARWQRMRRSLPQGPVAAPEAGGEWADRAITSLAPLVPKPRKGSGWVVVLAGLGTLVALYRGVRAFGVNPANLLASVSRAVRVKDLEAQTGFRHRFASEFRDVTEALRPRDMVIFVDDLDRCHPDQVLEVLEAINFLVSSGDCVVIMGMDPERVVRCVGLGFKDVAEEFGGPEGSGTGTERQRRADFARHYLEKLVNIEVPVPTPSTDQLRQLLAPGSAAGPNGTAPAHGWRPALPHRIPRPVVHAFMVLAIFAASRASLRPATPEPDPGAGAAALEPRDTMSTDTGVPRTVPLAGARIRDASLASGRRAETLGIAPFAVLAVLLVGATVWRLLNRPDVVVRDSQPFQDALRAWAPVIVERRATPRATKRFLNRLRFYAMRQRANAPPTTRVDRLLDAARRRPALGALMGWLGVEERNPPVAAGGIPEPVLVALAAIEECRPAWEEFPQMYQNFPDFVQQSDLPEEVKQGIAALEYPASVEAYRERFKHVSAGVRMS